MWNPTPFFTLHSPLLIPTPPRTLRSDLERHGRLPVADCIQIALSLATALQHLHEYKLVHRDIKPSNVIFVNGIAKLGDIGLVTDAGDTQSIVGTEGYLPPEGPGTPQADLYSLGKVLYEAVTGLDRRQLPKLPEDLRSWPDTAQVFEFNEIVVRAGAKQVEARYATAKDLRAELELLQSGRSVQRARRWRHFGRWAAVVVLACFVSALLLTVFRTRPGTDPVASSADGPPSTNELANALCARGLLIARGDNYSAFAEAYTNFHEAIRLDPYFARPYVGLLELRVSETVPGVPEVTFEEISGIASNLARLAPRFAASYSAQSVVAYCEPDYAKAREFGQRAVTTDPNYAFGRAVYGWMLINWGWPAQGRKEAELARGLQPSKAPHYQMLGNSYFMERNFPKAIEAYRQALRWESHRVSPYQSIAMASLATGDAMTAISSYEQIRIIRGTHDADSIAWHDALRRAVAEEGIPGYWRKLASKHTQKPVTNFYAHAVCRMHLGHTNDALALLEKSVETRERNWIVPATYILLWDTAWDGVRGNPRFQNLLDRVGFTKVMPKQPIDQRPP